MKIGILTHYEVLNQGAQLQMYALYHQLMEMHMTPFILTYEKNFDFEKGEQLKNKITIKSIPYILKNYLIKKGIGLTIHNIKKYRMMKRFCNKNFNFLDYTSNEIDIASIGSDEVFSIPVGINKMMFGHGINAKCVISYAPSFGQTDIDRIRFYHCDEIIIKGLSKFTAISARDTHTAEMVKYLTGRDAQIVCDPVLLYDFTQIETKFKQTKFKYIVVYAYDRHMNETEQINAIREFAHKRNLSIVSPGTYHKWCDVNVVCDPLEWVEWFKNAEYVITDTFHGTIISTITNRKMAIYIRAGINKNKIEDLIGRLGIEDRKIDAITEEQLEHVLNRVIDFIVINKNVHRLRENGKNYLENSIRLGEEISLNGDRS